MDDQSDDQVEELEENARENPVERLNNMEALTAEAEAGLQSMKSSPHLVKGLAVMMACNHGGFTC